ncbi:MAG: (2Fe-2S)-binding protein [Acidobacteriia bacterium]|nr:(2Fe-2S)-binding protein [Terriglobia bacterium]
MAKVTELRINGKRLAVEAEGETSLLTVLRDQLDLTGTKYGCGEGQCGACTVLINGNPRRSCLTPVSAAEKKEITTIEGLATGGYLHRVQQAFLDEEALQCGYCTSGMIMTAVALLRTHPQPSDEEIARFMEGNLCRCGTYPRIVAAVRRAAERQRKSG